MTARPTAPAQDAPRGCGASVLTDVHSHVGTVLSHLLGVALPGLGTEPPTQRFLPAPLPTSSPVLATKIYPTIFESANLHFSSS